MHLHTGTHVVSMLFGMSVNWDTIFTTWLSALIVFLIVQMKSVVSVRELLF